MYEYLSTKKFPTIFPEHKNYGAIAIALFFCLLGHDATALKYYEVAFCDLR